MRLIDADELKKVIFSKTDSMEDLWDTAGVLNAINNAPTVIWCSETSEGLPLMDLRPRPQGEWRAVYPVIKGEKQKYPNFKCSNCGDVIGWTADFCPSCGAMMKYSDLEDED